MKSMMICIVIVLSLCALVSADGYGSSYTASYTPNVLDIQGSVSAVFSTVGGLCSNIIANLGIQGCIALLQLFNLGLTSQLLCQAQIIAYVTGVVGALVKLNVLTIVGGAVTLVTGLLGGLLVSVLSIVGALAGIAGGVIVGAGGNLIAGVSTTITADLVAKLKLGFSLVASLNSTIACASSKCDDY